MDVISFVSYVNFSFLKDELLEFVTFAIFKVN